MSNDACNWCVGVTGQPMQCICKKDCSSPKCPIGVDGYDSGWRDVPVPTFEKKEEQQ